MNESRLTFRYEQDSLQNTYQTWVDFLKEHALQYDYEVFFTENGPIVTDRENRKFHIDFIHDRNHYYKTKSGLNKEPLARALGSGQKGFKLLDLSAGLGVDSVFLSQMGFQVTAIERNPLIYMCLKIAEDKALKELLKVPQFILSESNDYLNLLQPGQFDVAYFDPMFPDKKKSALPKQEMVVFKNLVGHDEDAKEIIENVCHKKLFKRFVVKRPLAAEAYLKPDGAIHGKIIRYDIYSSH